MPLDKTTIVNDNVSTGGNTMTTPLLKKCLNCDTHTKDFYEEYIDKDTILYECPNCGETYDGDELSEDMS